MAFRTNASKAQESGNTLKPEGDYEVIISTAEVTRTNNGKDKINLVYTIRNDVTQGYQNGLIFHSIWKKKEPNEDDMSIGGYNFANLMAVANAAKLPDGKEYADLNALLAELVGKPIKVHLYHDDYNDKYYEKIDIHFSTDHPNVTHKPKAKTSGTAYSVPKSTQFAQPAPATVTAASEADDDYPF